MYFLAWYAAFRYAYLRFEQHVLIWDWRKWQLGEPDLLIRTSGEQRLSDFLLWEVRNSITYLPCPLSLPSQLLIWTIAPFFSWSFRRNDVHVIWGLHHPRSRIPLHVQHSDSLIYLVSDGGHAMPWSDVLRSSEFHSSRYLLVAQWARGMA